MALAMNNGDQYMVMLHFMQWIQPWEKHLAVMKFSVCVAVNKTWIDQTVKRMPVSLRSADRDDTSGSRR